MADAAATAGPDARCPRARSGSCATWCGTWAACTAGPPGSSPAGGPRSGTSTSTRWWARGPTTPSWPAGSREGVRGAGRGTRGGPARSRVLDLPAGSLPAGHVGPPPGPRDGHPPGRRRARGRAAPSPFAAGLRRRRRRRAAGVLRAPPLHQAARRAARRPWPCAAPTRTRPGCCASGPRASRRESDRGGGRSTPTAPCGARRPTSTWPCGIAPGPRRWSSRATATSSTLFLDTVQVRWA